MSDACDLQPFLIGLRDLIQHLLGLRILFLGQVGNGCKRTGLAYLVEFNNDILDKH
jgi:hypothetical protein